MARLPLLGIPETYVRRCDRVSRNHLPYTRSKGGVRRSRHGTTPKIQQLTQALEEEVEKRPVTRLLTTHPGVGPLTALAYALVIGTPERFHCAKQIASYVGLVPEEKSSGDRRRLGHISKQGNAVLRFLLVEAAQVTQSAAMAQQVLASCPAARAEDRQSGNGPQAGGASALDVAAGPRLQPVANGRFARGRARKSLW